MPEYHFQLGTIDSPVIYTAAVQAESPEAAATALREHFPIGDGDEHAQHELPLTKAARDAGIQFVNTHYYMGDITPASIDMIDDEEVESTDRASRIAKFLRDLAKLGIDGECPKHIDWGTCTDDCDEEEFERSNDDSWSILNGLIEEARELIKPVEADG